MAASRSLVVHTSDAEETRSVAAALASLCEVGDVVLLVGDLGAGKTTFAQGFGRALGIVEPITSPTFTLVRQYPIPIPSGHASTPSGEEENGSVELLLHADMYRLDHLREVADLGIGELVEDGAVALVEWGEAAEPVLGRGSLTVRLVAGRGCSDPDDPDDPDGRGDPEDLSDSGQRRTLTVSSSSARWSERWADLGDAFGPWSERR
jgi:tRNA threonylcarbamoyladenosine biosynthesis protein TsaE